MGGNANNLGTQTAAGGWQPPPGGSLIAPPGPVGGNALLDWLGPGGMPSIPNPNTLGQFFAGGGSGGGNGGGQGSTPQTSPYWSGNYWGGAAAPTLVQQPPAGQPAVGGYKPSLPNPDVGTYGGGQGSVGQPQPVHSIPGLKLPQMGGMKSNGKF